MYDLAFWSARSPDDERLWLRGVIVPACNVDDLWGASTLSEGIPNISLTTISEHLLDAIALEQAGFKGMRLLVSAAATSRKFRFRQYVSFAPGVNFRRFRKLIFSTYPATYGELYDFLWMVQKDENRWRATVAQARDLARWAGRNPEEFEHAAATLIVVESCAALLDDMLINSGRNPFYPERAVPRRHVDQAICISTLEATSPREEEIATIDDA